MSSPIRGLPGLSPKARASNGSDEDDTLQDDDSNPKQSENAVPHGAEAAKFLSLDTNSALKADPDARSSIMSPSKTREQASRLDDELRMLQVERQVSRQNEPARDGSVPTDIRRQRSARDDVADDFDLATNPLHERTAIYHLPEHPTTAIARFLKRVHQSSFLVRYFVYILPVALIFLVPLLLGALKFKDASVGGVKMDWFCIWLEIVWLTLWAGRILAKALPRPIGVIASLFTNNDKKWRDLGKQLEVPATLFFWWLGIEISFLPTMIHHQVNGHRGTLPWMTTMNKVIISFFAAAVLNFIAKLLIQLIAMNFHLRTYQDRIEMNKFQIGSLTKLYEFSRQKIQMEDSDFEVPSVQLGGSGARTPAAIFEKAQKNTKTAFNKFGDVAGKIAGDFTGRKVLQSTHPQQVVLALLGSTGGSQLLARRLYRTFCREETETVHQDELNDAFDNQEEADAAFSMFDRDMNGDISMEELEAACVEIGRERKSITASLKDLDSVVGKLDNVFIFIVFVIWVLVLLSLLSTSAAGVLTSLGSAVLGLSWLLAATAQDFLQSVMFVFAKHPFDVGDRIRVYGNTGSTLQGDDYFVKEMSLLYTEFKKMEGHVVQAPNSYLNTLFIMNHRRSGGLAESIPMVFKFGTTLEQIDNLRQKLLDFVTTEKREYQPKILTEMLAVIEAHSISLQIVFFFKSNWQNELLRLQRRNKFICALMVAMQECGIEGPRMRYPGQKDSFPVYLQSVPYSDELRGKGGHPDNPDGELPAELVEEPIVRPASYRGPSPSQGPSAGRPRVSSIMDRTDSQHPRPRGETLSAMDRRVDFSLGMRGMASGDTSGDVFADRDPKPKIPISVKSPSPSRERYSTSTNAPSRFSISRPRQSVDVGDIAHSTSREMNHPPKLSLNRSVTEGSAGGIKRLSSLHRNRFFGRTSHEEGHLGALESGMAGIPETEREMSGAAFQMERIDPRTGFISPAAVRMSTDDEGDTIRSGGPAT